MLLYAILVCLLLLSLLNLAGTVVLVKVVTKDIHWSIEWLRMTRIPYGIGVWVYERPNGEVPNRGECVWQIRFRPNPFIRQARKATADHKAWLKSQTQTERGVS